MERERAALIISPGAQVTVGAIMRSTLYESTTGHTSGGAECCRLLTLPLQENCRGHRYYSFGLTLATWICFIIGFLAF